VTSREARFVAKASGINIGEEFTNKEANRIWVEIVRHAQILVWVWVQGRIVPSWQQLLIEHRLPRLGFIHTANISSVVPFGKKVLIRMGLSAGYEGDLLQLLVMHDGSLLS